MNLVGAKHIFAFEWEFLSDPDAGQGATEEESASWGAFSIWVHRSNLCRFKKTGEVYSSVIWYLLPMIEWFAYNWSSLLKERALHTLANAEQIQDEWIERHCLHFCSYGGDFPNITIRGGSNNSVCLSWNHCTPKNPDSLFFTTASNLDYIPLDYVERVLKEFLLKTSKYLQEKLPESKRLNDLLIQIKAIK